MTPEEVLCKVFGVDRAVISDQTSNKNLPQWDSLAHMMMTIELESTYGVSFSASAVLAMTSVTEIKRRLQEYGANW